MPRTKSQRLVVMFLMAIGPLAWSMGGCSKKEEPAPTPAVEEPEEKPKKKKKKTDDEDTTDVGAPTGEEDVGAPKVVGTGGTKVTTKTDGGSSGSDADKAKLIACCSALRKAAQAAGVAEAAGSAVVPGMPSPPPKEQLDKSVAECDKQVANFNGDLNESLKKVKGASPVSLPAACVM